MSELQQLFAPRSIALVGASADPAKFGGRPLRALRKSEFEGDLFVVNPGRDEIDGVRSVPHVAALPDGLDLAVILVSADAAVEAVEACVAKGFSAVAVFSGGFAETGREGAARQDRLASVARRGGVRLLGPNCPGFVNVRDRVACSASAFAQRERMFPGATAFVVQSGAVGGILADRAFDRGIGVNAVVCTGNEADLNVADMIDWFANDPWTRSVGLFLEGLGSGGRLTEALRRARQRDLRVAALKVGATDQGRRVVASHTGTLVGTDASFDAMCRRYGVVRVGDYDELLEATHLLAVAPHVGRRIAVVGSSGGMNALLTDAATERGIEIPELSKDTAEHIAEVTPPFGTMTNPVDISSLVLVDPERLGAAVHILGADPSIDTVVVVIGDHPADLSERFARTVTEAARSASVPIVIQWSAGALSLPGIRAAARAGYAVVTEPSRCARLLDLAAQAHTAGGRPIAPSRPMQGGLPDANAPESNLKAHLHQAGFPVPRNRVVHDTEDAPAAVEAVGGTAVVKADCIGPVHKSDVGAVDLDVTPAKAAAAAERVFTAAREAFGPDAVRGILVEEQVAAVGEFIVSLVQDEHVGALITVGTGGELVELIGDVETRVAPVGEEEAMEMIDALRGATLAAGLRGRPRGDIAALASVVVRLSATALEDQSAVRMIELNPVAVLTEGAVVLDAVVQGERSSTR